MQQGGGESFFTALILKCSPFEERRARAAASPLLFGYFLIFHGD
jgi:hypothetical protein